PARRVVQGVRHVPLRSSTSSLHRLVDLIQRQEVLSISLRRLTATARTLNPPSLQDVVQFALKLHHEQRVTRPHTLRNRRELLEVPVTKVLRRLTSHLEPLRALTVLNHILERALRDSQRRTRNLLRVRDAHIPGQFPSRVHRLEVLPLIHQGLPLLHQPVQVAALLLVPGAGLPPGRDPGIQVLDLTTKVIDLVLGDPPGLLELGPRLVRGHGLSLSPHLVDLVRRQVTTSSHRQVLTRGQHLINQARRLIHRRRQRHAVLRPILSPRDPLRVTRSPLEQVVLRLGQRIPHSPRVLPDPVVDQGGIRLVPLTRNLRVRRRVRDLTIPDTEVATSPPGRRRLNHPVRGLRRVRDELLPLARAVVCVQHRRRHEPASLGVETPLVASRLPQSSVAPTHLLLTLSLTGGSGRLLSLPGLHQGLLAELDLLSQRVPQSKIRSRRLLEAVDTVQRRLPQRQVSLELLDLLSQTLRGLSLHVLTPLLDRHPRDLTRASQLLLDDLDPGLDLRSTVHLSTRRPALPLEGRRHLLIHHVDVLEIRQFLHQAPL